MGCLSRFGGITRHAWCRFCERAFPGLEEERMIIEKLRQVYPQLTKSQRLLADFIAESYQEVAFMTASRVARRLGLNEATVIRFAQRLGYPGYPALIKDVQEIVHAELQTTSDETENGAAQFRALTTEELDTMQRLLSHVQADVAQRAISLLLNAQQIVIIAQGLSAPLGQIMANNLSLLGVRTSTVVSDSLSIALALDGANAQFLVVAICWAHESPETARALLVATQRGAHTLVLASSPISPCAQSAEMALSYPLPDLMTMPSVTMMALLIDTLMQMLAQQMGAAPLERLNRSSLGN
jgi:DNA-binding MurR/RpiR family transcriptional regulator